MTVTEDRTRNRAVALRERATKAAVERRSRWARRSLILPAVLYTIVVTQIPFVITIWYSLQSWNLLRPGTRGGAPALVRYADGAELELYYNDLRPEASNAFAFYGLLRSEHVRTASAARRRRYRREAREARRKPKQENP